MSKVWDSVFGVLDAFIVFALAAMVVMVFGNVVLRYGFNSGIEISEEMSRYLFVWMTFIGAITTYRKHAHLGVETLVQRFGPRGRVIAMTLSDAAVVACCAVIVMGTWKQHAINASTHAPVTGLSMIWVYGVLYLTGVGIGLMALARVIRTVCGFVDPREVRIFAGEFDDEVSQLRARAE